jgi:short-subunit dehydrogenase
MLSSYKGPINAAIIGATGGIGRALINELTALPNINHLYTLSRKTYEHDTQIQTAMLHRIEFDLINQDSIQQAANGITHPLNMIIIATGHLHDASQMPEKNWDALDADAMSKSFAINTIGPALLLRYLLPKLGTNG